MCLMFSVRHVLVEGVAWEGISREFIKRKRNSYARHALTDSQVLVYDVFMMYSVICDVFYGVCDMFLFILWCFMMWSVIHLWCIWCVLWFTWCIIWCVAKKDLLQHTYTHLDKSELPFRCEHCPNAYAQKSNLTVHQACMYMMFSCGYFDAFDVLCAFFHV